MKSLFGKALKASRVLSSVAEAGENWGGVKIYIYIYIYFFLFYSDYNSIICFGFLSAFVNKRKVI